MCLYILVGEYVLEVVFGDEAQEELEEDLLGETLLVQRVILFICIVSVVASHVIEINSQHFEVCLVLLWLTYFVKRQTDRLHHLIDVLSFGFNVVRLGVDEKSVNNSMYIFAFVCSIR